MSSESTESAPSETTTVVGSPRGEAAALVAIQSALAGRPGVVTAARAYSLLGEHSAVWTVASIGGWAIGRARGDVEAQRRFAAAGIGAFGAHAASVIIKRVVRRPRPHDPHVRVQGSTQSRLSFPSSHSTSTTAAAILLGRAVGLPPVALPAVLVPPMLLSRLVLGVHYPTDVAAGAALGAASAVVVARSDTLAPRRVADLIRRAR